MHLAHLEEESAEKDEEVESKDPNSIDRITEELMVHLARAMKDTQVEEKCCYHFGALHLWLPISKNIKSEYAFKLQGGDCTKEGSLSLSDKSDHTKNHPGGGPQGVGWHAQTPFLNPDPFQCWYGVKNVAIVKINGESCMALLSNGVQINTIMPSYVKSHLLEMGPITNLISRRVTCIGLGNTYTQSLGYIIVKVQVDGVQG